MARAVTVGLLSDSRLFRETIAFRLAREEGMEVVAAAATVQELHASTRARHVEVLVVHGDQQDAASATLVWDIKALLPAARMIVVGVAPDDSETVRWIEAGALACLNDEASYSMLVNTVFAVAQGRTACSQPVLTQVIHRLDQFARMNQSVKRSAEEPLSDREAEVLNLMARGLADKQIARHLGIRPPTVKSHVHSVLQKLRIKRRQDAMKQTQEGGYRGEG